MVTVNQPHETKFWVNTKEVTVLSLKMYYIIRNYPCKKFHTHTGVGVLRSEAISS